MINIIPTQELTRIYLVTNCYGDPNKVYIGKEKDGSYRKYTHKQTFGKNIIFTYIDEINSLKHKDWKPLECFWISYFKFLGFEVQNKNSGGGGVDFCSRETRLKKSKHILQYDLEGNFIKEWPSLVSAGIHFFKDEKSSNISRSCRTEKRCSNFLWRYKTNNYPLKIKSYKRNNHQERLTKPIIQKEMDGTFIKEWLGIKYASKELKINSKDINSCCREKLKTAGKFKWIYK